MRGLRRCAPSGSMVIALAALVVAVGGVAFAATGGFVGPSGEISACVADRDLLETAVDLVAPVTHVVVKAGTMRVVKPGEACRTGESPLAFNQTGPAGPAASAEDLLPKVFATQNTKETKVDDDMTGLAAKTLPAGSFIAQGTVQLESAKNLPVAQTFECSFVDPKGKVIAASTRTVTFAAKQAAAQSQNVPMNTLINDMPAGKLKIACEDKTPPASGARAAASSGSTQGNAQYSAQQTETKPPSCASGSFCVWQEANFKGTRTDVKVDVDAKGKCYIVRGHIDERLHQTGNKSIVNNTGRTVYLFDGTGFGSCNGGTATGASGDWTRPASGSVPQGEARADHGAFSTVGL